MVQFIATSPISKSKGRRHGLVPSGVKRYSLHFRPWTARTHSYGVRCVALPKFIAMLGVLQCCSKSSDGLPAESCCLPTPGVVRVMHQLERVYVQEGHNHRRRRPRRRCSGVGGAHWRVRKYNHAIGAGRILQRCLDFHILDPTRSALARRAKP